MSADAQPDPVDEYRMSILDHLRELRTRLIVSLWAVGVGIVVCFFISEHIFAFLVEPMNAALAARGEGTMAITDPLEAVVTYLKVAVLSGFFAASPIVFYQTWQFIGPGLYQSEKKVVLPLVVSSTVLFSAGAAFGYFVIFRYGFEFFLSMADPENTSAVLSINAYLMTATKLLVAFGASFQLPVIVFFLARMGLIDAKDMAVNFRYAIVGIFIVAAIITPPDPLTQCLMAGPLMLLYVISMGVAWAVSTKQREPAIEG
ncbi:MAG: twin-arginine translocase subunit TatC [Alphaproteobacteria bacterium]|nr:twin-arginine translocase subunit TatC [Alphaproteobacteria bacterium]